MNTVHVHVVSHVHHQECSNPKYQIIIHVEVSSHIVGMYICNRTRVKV